MIKTTSLTKTLFTHQTHSQRINLYTPSTTSSSGSICETDPSSMSSSYKSNIGTNGMYINDETKDESTLALITLTDKLKRDLATVKQAKSQLETLYKVKCKSDLDKSAKITKLRLQFEYELNTFCKQDQKDLVCYLQRQLTVRDQRIAEQSYDIEQLKTSSGTNNTNEDTKKKTAQIQILRSNDPDLVISANRPVHDEQERTSQRQEIELHDRVKRFERQFEVLKQDQPKDHDKEFIKRALARQASKDAAEYQKMLTKKNEEIEQLNIRLKQLSKSNLLESALRQANIEKLHLERLLLASRTSSTLNTTANAGVSRSASY